MELLGIRIEYILVTCVFLLLLLSVYLMVSLRKERYRIGKVEQATTHLALALETLNSENSESPFIVDPSFIQEFCLFLKTRT